jgi:hypothetical protein
MYVPSVCSPAGPGEGDITVEQQKLVATFGFEAIGSFIESYFNWKGLGEAKGIVFHSEYF